MERLEKVQWIGYNAVTHRISLVEFGAFDCLTVLKERVGDSFVPIKVWHFEVRQGVDGLVWNCNTLFAQQEEKGNLF